MAEYCLECWNEINNIKLKEKQVILSKEPDLCEGCGELRRVIVCYKRNWLLRFLIR